LNSSKFLWFLCDSASSNLLLMIVTPVFWQQNQVPDGWMSGPLRYRYGLGRKGFSWVGCDWQFFHFL